MNNKPNAKAIMPDGDIADNAPSEFSHYNPKVNEYTSIADGVRLLDDMRRIQGLKEENVIIAASRETVRRENRTFEAEIDRLRARVEELEHTLAIVRPILRSFKTVTIPAVSKTLDQVNAALLKGGK